MKKIKINWFKVYFDYWRDNGTFKGEQGPVDGYTIETNKADINKLMRDFKKYAKSWSGNGFIRILSIDAGGSAEAEKWAENHNHKFQAKTIRFKNQQPANEKKIKKGDLKNFTDEEILKEAWARNGSSYVIIQSYDEEDLQELVGKSKVKKFMRYLADSDIYECCNFELLQEYADNFEQDL